MTKNKIHTLVHEAWQKSTTRRRRQDILKTLLAPLWRQCNELKNSRETRVFSTAETLRVMFLEEIVGKLLQDVQGVKANRLPITHIITTLCTARSSYRRKPRRKSGRKRKAA